MDFDFKELKKLFKDWQNGMESGNGWNALFWCNHDQPRIVSWFGNCSQYHKESAKMLATSIHMMRGTPYIYQGEEFGMTNPEYISIKQYRDVESINFYNILINKGLDKEKALEILREKSRTPVQWNNNKNAGFTSGEPWIPVGNLYKNTNLIVLNNFYGEDVM